MLIAFAAIATSAFSQNIIKGEYFIDTDPGFGKATGFAIVLPDSDFSQAITIPYASFSSPGYHNLFMRTKDSNGNWSQTSRSFVEADDNSNLSKIVKVEYFFTGDKGFGNNSFVLLDASSDKTWDFKIPFNQLPAEWKANDSLFVRVQDGTFSRWSQTAFIGSLNFVMVGIENLKETAGVSVYPNPFSDEINISLENDGIVRLVLYNDLGQLVLDKEVVKSDEINAQPFQPGVYLLVVYADKEKLYGTKIIKR